MALVPAVGCVLLGLVVRADLPYFVFSLLLLLPMVLRRRHVVLCGALVLCVGAVQWLTVRDSTGALFADIAVPLAVHAAVAHGPPWAGRVGLAAGLAGAVLGGLSWPQLPVSPVMHVVVGTCLASTVVAAWAVGSSQRVRRAEAGALAERARLLEVERDQRARLAVLAERNRIAREMHDIVAHSLTVVIAQADGGRYAPEAASSALTTIGEYARQALGETRRVLAAPVAPKVVMLTTYDLDEHALAAIRAGASGFLLKDATPEELLAAVRTVHAGDAVIAPSTTRRLLDQLAPPLDPVAAQLVATLTGREREVLVAMARGFTNAEIAERLVVAAGTVKTHVGNILAKLWARDRVQAVVIAYEAGLVRPGDRAAG